MIVELNGQSPKVARAAAFGFLEKTNGAKSLADPAPRKYVLSPEAHKIERERMRAKVKGTKQMRAGILAVLDRWRDAVVKAISKVRESEASDVDAAITSAAAAGLLTPEQAQSFIAQIDVAVSDIDPTELAQVISDIQAQLYQAGLQSASAEVGISFDIPPQGALDVLQASTLSFSQDVVDRELLAIKDALTAGISSGDSVPKLTQRIKDVFDDGMHITDADGNIVRVIPSDSWAEMVARTETAKAMNAAVFRTYHAAGVKMIQWVAAEDERTCFPAGTAVRLACGGSIPIEEVEVGDLVATPNGTRRVMDTLARDYRGAWSLLRFDKRELLCTADHPIWTDGGWLHAGQVNAGNILQTCDDQFAEVRFAAHFVLSETNDGPAAGGQERFFLLISRLREVVPVRPVDLDCDHELLEREVYRIAANAKLLSEGLAKLGQSHSNEPLDRRLAGVGAIAGEAAERTLCTGASAEAGAAVQALLEDGRPAAEFAAVRSVPQAFAGESLTAARAVDVDGACDPASFGADRVSVRGRRWNLEDLPAHWACLGHAFAFERTPETLADLADIAAPDGAVVRDARYVRSDELLAALGAGEGTGHTSILAEIAAGKPVRVYSLEVDQDHVFFAGGALVHNCQVCSDLDGEQVMLGDDFDDGIEAPPDPHPGCRCTTISVRS